MKKKCDRCHEETKITIMSKFNRDTLCVECKEDEMKAPGYAAAATAELQACKDGNYNFPGVGLSRSDATFLSRLRKQRKQKSRHKSDR